ncbi:MAG TPA: citrate synthase [Acidimicrobiales bacterium]
MGRMLESEEAARRLGVKMATLYAYVSRGLLASYPSDDSRRRRLFDVEDVEQLARRSRGARQVESRLASVTTAITQIREDGTSYRGHPIGELAATATFEEAADLLWRAEAAPAAWVPVSLPRPPRLDTGDLLRWVTVMCGARDRLRADLREELVIRSARRLITTMVSALPTDGWDVTAPGKRSTAERLTRHLVPAEVSARLRGELNRTVDVALVLLADHELATSTVAVRVAASTRADLYDAVLAGLGTLAGPLHGGASQLAYSLLVDAAHHGAERALNECLRWQRVLPGFGHTVYKHGDPRVAPLLECFDRLAGPDQRALVSSLIELAADHNVPAPNVDLALAAVTWATGMPTDAGRTIFTIARVAGWTAHYLEELNERPLRFRARAVYATAR